MNKVKVDISECGKWFLFDFNKNKEAQKYLKENAPLRNSSEYNCPVLWFDTFEEKHIKDLTANGIEVEFTDKAKKIFERDVAQKAQDLSFDFDVDNSVNGLKLDLFDHQAAALKALDVIIHEDFQQGALICDVMGLGKTVEALAYLIKEERKALIVCPNNAKDVWANEIKKFTDKRFIVIDSSTTDEEFQHALLHDFVVVNYELLKPRLDKLKLIAVDRVIVADEIHEVRNSSTNKCRALQVLKLFSKFVIGLTGTPIWNREEDLIPILELVGHNWIKHKSEFIRRYSGSKVGHQQLHERLQSIMIRRLRHEVGISMPSKNWIDKPVDLDNQYEYDYAEKNFLQWVREVYGKNSATKAMKAEAIVYLNRMRELSAIGKHTAATDFIHACMDEDEPVIIFSCHTKILEKLKDSFGSAAALYYGNTPKSERYKIEKKFNKGDIPIFLGSTRCAKQALSLTGGSVIGFLDYPWSPMTMLQAAARPDRIVGQDKPIIHIYKLMASNIDKKMNEVIKPKIEIADNVSGDVDKIGHVNKSVLLDVLNSYGIDLGSSHKKQKVKSQSGQAEEYYNW